MLIDVGGNAAHRFARGGALLLVVTLACGSGADAADPAAAPPASGGAATGGSTGPGGSPQAPGGAGGPGMTGGVTHTGGVTTAGAATGGGATAGASGAGGRGGESAAGASGAGGGAAGSSPGGGATIENDRFWLDTSGVPIYSQGGGVLQVGDTFYWYGVKYGGAVTYAQNPHGKVSDTSFQGVTTYSSKDLVHWKLEATDKLTGAGGWFGRLGVAYNAKTKKYVLAAQGGGGLYFATSDKPSGGFVFDNVQTNLPGIVNGATGDQTVFQDDDGQAYLISSSSSGRANRYVSPLRASDFLRAEEAWFVYKGGGREGNCMFKQAGTYYHCSSDLHGWNTSQTYCVSATSLKGPWSEEFVLAGTEADYSHVTQTGFFISVKGSAQTQVIFAGDRWADFAGNGLGYNQWMPLSFEGGKPYFHSLSAWNLDVSTGKWSVAKQNNYALNPSFEADRISVTTPVGWKATNGANAKGGRNGNWSWQLSGSATLSQSLTQLPSGTYTLSVWAKSSAAGATLHVKNHGGPTASIPIAAGSSWQQLKLEGVKVTSGAAELGVTSSGQTVTLDDFSFVLQ